MLPLQHRLHRSADIRRTTKGGHRFVGRNVIVHIDSDASRVDAPRVCVIVSKSVGNAVERNLVRRRLRESMRSLVEWLPVGTDVVVRARALAGQSSYASLNGEVGALIKKWLVADREVQP